MARLKAAIRRIATVGLVVSSVPATALSPTDDTNTYEVPAHKLEHFLSQHIADDFSGALLIVQNGKVAHAQGYGLASREKNIPNGLETVFSIGELTQYFTATAILKLVEQNKLNLEDTLPELFDNVPEDKRAITVHHLLTHTPGLFGDQDLNAFEQADTETFLKEVFSKSNSISPAVYLPTFTFQPGDRLIGFSEGYSLLAQIIEKRSGQSFEAFLNDQLFKPAGLKNTGYQIPDWGPDQLADGYLAEDGENWGNLPARLANGAEISPYMKGSMGLQSTVEDLYTWHKALHGGTILRADLLDLLHKPHIGATEFEEADVDYAYGIGLSETWTGTPWIFNWDTSFIKKNQPAFTTRYHYFPDDKTVLIYASNEPLDSAFFDTMNQLIRILLEPDYNPASLTADGQR